MNAIYILLFKLNLDSNLLRMEDVFQFYLEWFLENWLLWEIVTNVEWHRCAKHKWKNLLFKWGDVQRFYLDQTWTVSASFPSKYHLDVVLTFLFIHFP